MEGGGGARAAARRQRAASCRLLSMTRPRDSLAMRATHGRTVAPPPRQRPAMSSSAARLEAGGVHQHGRAQGDTTLLLMTRPRGGSATRATHGGATAKAATSDELVLGEARGRQSTSALTYAGRHSAAIDDEAAGRLGHGRDAWWHHRQGGDQRQARPRRGSRPAERVGTDVCRATALGSGGAAALGRGSTAGAVGTDGAAL
uniref:Uncharacterized protein n=1 Tax=Arundo donax TaxID=35708 RepID=A0A0A9TNT0_ARUDO